MKRTGFERLTGIPLQTTFTLPSLLREIAAEYEAHGAVLDRFGVSLEQLPKRWYRPRMVEPHVRQDHERDVRIGQHGRYVFLLQESAQARPTGPNDGS